MKLPIQVLHSIDRGVSWKLVSDTPGFDDYAGAVKWLAEKKPAWPNGSKFWIVRSLGDVLTMAIETKAVVSFVKDEAAK